MNSDERSRLPSNAAQEAAAWVMDACRQQGTTIRPSVGIILGSGLNELLHDAKISQRFSYTDIPHFAPTTVEGHVGQLELGTLNDHEVAVLRGRYHFYEGHSPQHLALPVRMLHALGVHTLIVTNAAGGLNPEFKQGDLMVLRDHIGLASLAGFNPLIGPNDESLGPRFTPMAEAYDPELIALTHDIALHTQMSLREGVYVMVSGPTYETPAEMRALRLMGADAVGMSTVPEVITARHMQMKVLGISCITNSATPETATLVNHEEVLLGAKQTLPKLDLLLHEFLHALTRKEKSQAALSEAPTSMPPLADRALPEIADSLAKTLPDIVADSGMMHRKGYALHAAHEE
jgi:purine-nucleoside phosphorylase